LPLDSRDNDAEPLLQIATLIEIKGPANIGRGGHLYLQVFLQPSCESNKFKLRYAGTLATGNDSEAFMQKANTDIGPKINQALDLVSELIGDPSCKDIFMLPFNESELYRVDNTSVSKTFSVNETDPILVIISDTDFDKGLKEGINWYDKLGSVCQALLPLLGLSQ
jgi:hypothetical protein